MPLGEFGRMGTILDEAKTLAETVGDQRRLGHALNFKAIHSIHGGDFAGALEHAHRALAIGDAERDIGIRAAANWYLGLACLARGEGREAIKHCEVGIALIPEALARERFGQSGVLGTNLRMWLATALGTLGRFAETLEPLREATRITEEVGHVYSRIMPLFALGTLKLDQGDFIGAVAPLDRGLELCRTGRTPLWTPDFTWALGAAYHATGRRADGIALMEDAARVIAERNVRWAWWPGGVGALGRAYLLEGRLAEAARIAHERLAAARQVGERGVEARILQLLGEIASHPACLDVDAAETHYHQALNLAEELGLRPLLAHCHLGLGKLAWHVGKQDQARESLATAVRMFGEMDMRHWQEHAERAMAGRA
jgi:tetratricopeptide (TPR) repeat protein